MSKDLLDIFLLALVSMFNPSLLAAVTVMLLLPNPKRLMVGYLLGAYTTSITFGLVIVFTLHSSSTESTSKHTISPLEDIVVGLLAVAIAFVLATGRDQPFQERRRAKKKASLKAKQEAGKPTESLPLRLLGKGDPKVTFVVGAILSFPQRRDVPSLGARGRGIMRSATSPRARGASGRLSCDSRSMVAPRSHPMSTTRSTPREAARAPSLARRGAETPRSRDRGTRTRRRAAAHSKPHVRRLAARRVHRTFRHTRVDDIA